MASRREVFVAWVERRELGSCMARRGTAGTYSLELMLVEDSLSKSASREEDPQQEYGRRFETEVSESHHDLLFGRDCTARAVIKVM